METENKMPFSGICKNSTFIHIFAGTNVKTV